MKASLLSRVTLALGATALACLVATCVFVLATGRSALPMLGKLLMPRASRGESRDASHDVGGGAFGGSGTKRRVGGAGTDSDVAPGGLYRVHADPRVGYVLKEGTDRLVLAGRVRSDELGLRARPGPPRGDHPLRIVVAGDSVAFGFGLEDEQTLAVRLEQELNAALGPGARPVECRSVALPGWNHRNTVAAVLDHEDVLAPDIVVYIPIANDIFDTDGVDEAGFRRTVCDPSAADPWLLANQNISAYVDMESARRLREAGRDDSWSTRGPTVIGAELSPESGRRLDENAASLVRLRQRMLDRGGHLLLAAYQDESYSQHLLRRFDDQHVPMDIVPLFTVVPDALKLPDDPHPNAEAVSAMSRWIAADLLARGWIPGAAASSAANSAASAAASAAANAAGGAAGGAAVNALPPVPEWIVALRAPVRTPDERKLLSSRTRRVQWQRLVRVIDLSAGDGCNQIYGGVFADGTAGPHALFLLPRPSRELVVQLAALPDRPDLLPLQVSVQVDGTEVGTLRLTATDLGADGSVTARFDLPQPPPAPEPGGETGVHGAETADTGGADDDAAARGPVAPAEPAPFNGLLPPMEARLVASRWVVQPAGNVSVLAAFRVVRLEAVRD